MEGLSDEEAAALWAPLLGKPAGTVIAALASMLGEAIVRLAPDRGLAEQWHLRACGCVQDVVAEGWAMVREDGAASAPATRH